MSLLQLILISIVQGITEWLPISSSAHVLLLSDSFGVTGRDELLINAVSNLGTLAAMLVYFRKDVASAVAGGVELLGAPVRKTPLSPGARLAACVIVATPLALIVALLYEAALPEAIQATLRSVPVVAGATIVFGLLLWWADAKGPRKRREEDMTLFHAFLIGATQAVAAIIPGTSRSGITMTAARALGYKRTEAARISMLIGAPILAAAGVYGAYGLFTADPDAGALLSFSDGMVVAITTFVTGLASIWGLMAYISKRSFLPFVIYRILLGLALFAAMPFLAA